MYLNQKKDTYIDQESKCGEGSHIAASPTHLVYMYIALKVPMQRQSYAY